MTPDPDASAIIETIEGVAVSTLLAHRFPFLLVDRIEIVERGRHVIGRKRITVAEWWSEGPSNASVVFPFSLVIEAMAQTSAGLMRDLVAGVEGTVAYFMGVTRVRLRAPASAGDELVMDLTLTQWRRGLCRCHAIATVDGRLVASADLTTIVRGAA